MVPHAICENQKSNLDEFSGYQEVAVILELFQYESKR